MTPHSEVLDDIEKEFIGARILDDLRTRFFALVAYSTSRKIRALMSPVYSVSIAVHDTTPYFLT